MQHNDALKFTTKDVGLARALRSIVHAGKYEIQGQALVQAGVVFHWLDMLDKKIEATVKEPPATKRKKLDAV